MIIGIDGSEAFVKERTGVESYAYQIITHLAKIDRENQYIVYLDPRTNQLEGEWPDNFKFKSLNWPFFWTQLGLGLESYTAELDLLFVPAHTVPLIRNPDLKTVITVHDLGAEYLPSYHQIKQAIYLKLITHLQLKSASSIIAVSEATKQDLIKKTKIPADKIRVIYEGINDIQKEDYDILIDILRGYGLENEKYFFFLGTIQPRKNLSRLIQAYAQLSPEFKLVLAGSKGWLSEDIYQLPNKLEIKDRVLFLGRVPDKDLPALYKGAIAFIYPSLFEGFGLPILEAFRYNCPVITSNLSSMPEVAGEAALLVNPYKTEEIKQAMEKVSSDKQLRQKMIKKGLEQLKKFSWEKAARETLKLFMEVNR